MSSYAFSGAVAETPGYGQKHKIRFGNTWVAGDSWTIQFTSTLLGSFTLGKGNIAGQTFTCGFKLSNRVYVGFGSNFALSSVNDPTLWEEQDPGTAIIEFLSQYGDQDTVIGFAVFTGKLVVFGKQSIQIWEPNADPAQFQLLQTLDQSGTLAELSIQNIGDSDVLYLDRTGVRSLRSKSLTLNAYVDDVGVAIDSLIRADLQTIGINNPTGASAVVEPSTKQYWLFLNNNLYLLSRFPTSEIQAWSKITPVYQQVLAPLSANYDASGNVSYPTGTHGKFYWVKGSGETQLVSRDVTLTDSFGIANISIAGAPEFAVVTGVPLAAVTGTFYVLTPWIPVKLVVHEGQIYVLATAHQVFRYGGSDGNTYDHSRLYFETPWLDLKDFSRSKQAMSLDAVMKGKWLIDYSTNIPGVAYRQAVFRGSPTSPDSTLDSTLDLGRFNLVGNGPRFKFRGTCYNDSAAIFGAMNIMSNKSD